MKGKVELTGMRFFARHGCYDEERIEGNIFMVDFSAMMDISVSAHSDDLADTVDYGRIYSIIEGEMDERSNLLENIAARMVIAVQSKFPQLKNIEIKVSKKNPPVAGEVEWSSITAYGE